MAPIGTFVFLYSVICFAAGRSRQNFVKAKCKDENMGLLGQQSMLECSVELSAEVSEVNIRVIDWKRKGEKPPVLLYNKGETNVKLGYDFADASWKKTLNVSLLIANTTVEDDGEFSLFVSTDSGDCKNSTSLKVKAKYSTPKVHSIPETILEDKDSMLICESGGGYPEGRLRWFDKNGQEWTASATMEAKQTENGLFQLSSKLSLLRGSTFDKYTCVVVNASGSKEAELPFELPWLERQKDQNGTSATKILAPVVVIGSLIVGLLVAVLLLHRRRARSRRPSTSPLMNSHHEVSRAECDVEEGDEQ